MMRSTFAALSLAFILGAASIAFAQTPPEGAAGNAQPDMPKQVSHPAGNNTDTSPTDMPVEKAPAPHASSEPNLKVLKNSGGKSESNLIKDAPLPSDYVMGKITAPVTIIEYASLSCPHCAHFSATTLPELEKKYIDTGKVRYIMRPFPLNEPALKGAMLLDCVGQQDSSKYYVFARVLFDAQSKWAFDGNWESGLETIATVGGLSKQQFEHCINNTDREMKILKIKKAANDELHVPHTPYIFIGGEVYEGDRSIEAMSQFIDAKLAQPREHK